MPDPNIAAWNHLDAKVRKLWRIEASITGFILLGVFVGMGFIVGLVLEDSDISLSVHPAFFGAGLGALIVLWAQYVAGRRFEFWRYEVGEDDLAVAHGIWWRTRTFVPRARIQHVDVTAGPIARSLGLAVISVFVSGHAGAVATIPGLRTDEAERLRKVLLKLSETVTPVIGDPLNG